MLKGLVDRIANALCESGLINRKDKEIYLFGIETALLKCIHFITMLIIGAAFGLILEAALFIVCYSALRIYAGGFHAKTKIGCYVISWIMIFSVMILVKCCPTQIICQTSLYGLLFSTVIILALSPESSPNKPLDQAEISHYKKNVWIISISNIFISALFWILHLSSLLLIVCLSEVSVAILLVLRKIQIKLNTSTSFQ